MTDDRIYELQLKEGEKEEWACHMCVWAIANNSKLKSTVNLTSIENSETKLFVNMPKIPKIYQSIP